MIFLNVEFWTFFFKILRFWLDLGRLRGFQKSTKIEKKKRVRDAFGTRLRFLIILGDCLGMVWEGFGMGFGRVSEGFFDFLGGNLGAAFQVEVLALMIRETRGRSMHGWIEKT